MRSSCHSRCAARSLLLLAALSATACAAGAERSTADAGTTECVNCHLPEYRAAKRPLHVGVKPTACAVCHTGKSWKPSVFNHPWPLTGAHADAACKECHRGTPAKYEDTPKLCIDCHGDDFKSASYPGHARFSTTCSECHSTEAWKPARKPDSAEPAPVTTRVEPRTRNAAAATRAEAAGARTTTGDTTALAPQASPAPAVPAAAAPEPPPSEPARHPENRFPIGSGSNHEGIGCRTCHDQGGANTKANTDCVQCHERSRYDGRHAGVDAYPQGPAPVNFCVRCHTAGTRRRG